MMYSTSGLINCQVMPSFMALSIVYCGALAILQQHIVFTN